MYCVVGVGWVPFFLRQGVARQPPLLRSRFARRSSDQSSQGSYSCVVEQSLASDTILPQRHHFMPRELPTTKTCHSCGHAQQKRVGNGKVVQPLESDVDMISQPSCGSIRTRHSRAARECTPITTSTTKALRILQPIAIHSLPTLSSLHGQLEAVKRGKCIVQRGGKSGKASAAASERHWMWLHLKCCHGNAVRTVKQTV